jgi:hypothetical protein
LYVSQQYTAALLRAVIALRPIIVGLKGKTDGKPYRWAEYNADVDAYQTAVNGYHALGDEMNRKWRTYQNEAAGSAESCEVRRSASLPT